MAEFRLTRLTTRSGTTVEIPPVGVLCIVGGNNVGKSRLLADIQEHLRGQAHRGVVLKDLEFELDLTGDSCDDWIVEHSTYARSAGQPDVYGPPNGGQHWQMDQIRHFMGGPGRPPQMGMLLDWFYRVLDAGQRVGIATSGMSMGGGGAIGTHGAARSPMQMLFRDGEMEARLSEICEKTFGFPLTLDRANGEVMLRVGTPGVASPPLQPPTLEYADAVLALDPLYEQGDGVKNYLGMVLHLMTANEAVTVIDEPEAFLHPAQARALGRHLGNEARMNERQLLTATHDRDFVLGLLASECPVTFLRINRTGNHGTAASLGADHVKAIWDKPALRYSNILQGLFHRAVVVCEGDADCRWYGAVLDEMGKRAEVASEEALFVPGGGKSQVPSSLEALASLDVRAFAILDFDVLWDTAYIGGLLTTLGGENEQAVRLSRAIASQLPNPSQRKMAKEAGLAGLPAGDVTQMARRLIEILGTHRVLIVPVGELESFDRGIGGHGPAWVTGALSARRHLSSEKSNELLGPVLAALGGRLGGTEPRRRAPEAPPTEEA